jgi:hypothetical protein
MNELTIKTSEKTWLATLSQAYKGWNPVLLVDDAGLGINPQTQSLLQMGKQSSLSAREWVGVLVSLGVSAFGAWMVVAAILDPDPTSKLGLLISGGTVCVLGGGFGAFRVLTTHKPPNIMITKIGIKIWWE